MAPSPSLCNHPNVCAINGIHTRTQYLAYTMVILLAVKTHHKNQDTVRIYMIDEQFMRTTAVNIGARSRFGNTAGKFLKVVYHFICVIINHQTPFQYSGSAHPSLLKTQPIHCASNRRVFFALLSYSRCNFCWLSNLQFQSVRKEECIK